MSVSPSFLQSSDSTAPSPGDHSASPRQRIQVDMAAAKILFSDSHEYRFYDPLKLQEALDFCAPVGGRAPNQSVTILGDTEFKTILARQWRSYSAGDIHERYYCFHQGLATNKFLAAQAKRNGLMEAMLASLPAGAPQPVDGELATTMEAVIGAVAEDSMFSTHEIEAVMRRLGIYWPDNLGESEALSAEFNYLHRQGEL